MPLGRYPFGLDKARKPLEPFRGEDSFLVVNKRGLVVSALCSFLALFSLEMEQGCTSLIVCSFMLSTELETASSLRTVDATFGLFGSYETSLYCLSRLLVIVLVT